jgi:HD-like signal output (HDOD) protein/nitrogen-specific signal transduction histidine kinase
MTDKRAAILERVLTTGSVPSISPLAVRLVELAADDRSSVQDLSRIIEQDPGLTARLLRLVNSPALRRSEDDITSISRAVVLLGLREVRIMALSISLRDTLPLKKGGQDFHLFWRSSLHRAILARETASRLALDCKEEAFVAGLLLEMGLPLLLWVLTPEEAAGFPGFGATLKRQLEWEEKNLGVNHREVCIALLKNWELPALLVEIMQVIKDPTQERAPILTEVTDFARMATEAFFLPEVHLTDIYGVAWRWFGLNDEAVNKILAAALSYVGEAAQAMDIELNQDADLLAVMEKANAALSRLSSQMEPTLRRMMEGDFSHASGPDSERLREKAMLNTLEAVAHEIRNPLMSVGGFAKRLASQMESSERAKSYAQVIISEAARLDQVLSEMVSVATPYHPHLQPIELTSILAGISQLLAKEPSARLESGLPPLDWHLPQKRLAAVADPEGLTTAVKNMISYAATLLDAPQSHMHVHLGERAGWTQITVFGPGSPQPKDDELAGKHFGPELGLTRARRIMEAHGGYLSAGSAPKGNGFVLTAALPQASQKAQP